VNVTASLNLSFGETLSLWRRYYLELIITETPSLAVLAYSPSAGGSGAALPE